MEKREVRPKHIPERTCVGCRDKKPKRELIRVVRTPQGTIEIDARGKKTGRGAYLCKTRDCWETSFNRKRLEHALKIEFSAEQRAELLGFANSLTVGNDEIE